ncbi:MAG: winged helix-turn-helix transcriptional regulator [Candidatus Gastranaerophilaceae bacterium]
MIRKGTPHKIRKIILSFLYYCNQFYIFYKYLLFWYILYKLQKILEGVTAKMLIQQLRELEEDGMVKRKVYPVVPPRVEYSLTELGKSIIPVLLEMKKWGEKYTEAYNREE